MRKRARGKVSKLPIGWVWSWIRTNAHPLVPVLVVHNHAFPVFVGRSGAEESAHHEAVHADRDGDLGVVELEVKAVVFGVGERLDRDTSDSGTHANLALCGDFDLVRKLLEGFFGCSAVDSRATLPLNGLVGDVVAVAGKEGVEARRAVPQALCAAVDPNPPQRVVLIANHPELASGSFPICLEVYDLGIALVEDKLRHNGFGQLDHLGITEAPPVSTEEKEEERRSGRISAGKRGRKWESTTG